MSPVSKTPISADLQPVAPAEPLAPYFGGKKYLAKLIASRIAAIPHRCYAEPFAGMGGVFLRRGLKPKSEILNDINGEIVNLYRILRDHPGALEAAFDLALSSRAEYARLIATPPETLTDVRRAARFAYIQRLAFGGKPAQLVTPGQTSFSPHHPARLSTARMIRLIRTAHKRLAGVHVECLDWRAFIARYDREFTLFYLDPPYPGHETDYGEGVFAPKDFEAMAEMLKAIKGRFILSVGDTPRMRELFAFATIEEAETRYSANIRATRRVRELLISG